MAKQTQVQRMENLAKANEVRYARSDLKKDLGAGLKTPQEILTQEFPSWLDNMTVSEFLEAWKGFGRIKTRDLLRTVYVHPALPMWQLTGRLRAELVVKLDERIGNRKHRKVAA